MTELAVVAIVLAWVVGLLMGHHFAWARLDALRRIEKMQNELGDGVFRIVGTLADIDRNTRPKAVGKKRKR